MMKDKKSEREKESAEARMRRNKDCDSLRVKSPAEDCMRKNRDSDSAVLHAH